MKSIFSLSVPPEIFPFPSPDALSAGDEVSLNCNAYKGDTPMAISWTFHGRDVSMDRKFNTLPIGQRTNILTMESVQHGHSGTYTCIARNAAGETSYSATLVVKGQSAVTRFPFFSYMYLNPMAYHVSFEFHFNILASLSLPFVTIGSIGGGGKLLGVHCSA